MNFTTKFLDIYRIRNIERTKTGLLALVHWIIKYYFQEATQC